MGKASPNTQATKPLGISDNIVQNSSNVILRFVPLATGQVSYLLKQGNILNIRSKQNGFAYVVTIDGKKGYLELKKYENSLLPCTRKQRLLLYGRNDSCADEFRYACPGMVGWTLKPQALTISADLNATKIIDLPVKTIFTILRRERGSRRAEILIHNSTDQNLGGSVGFISIHTRNGSLLTDTPKSKALAAKAMVPTDNALYHLQLGHVIAPSKRIQVWATELSNETTVPLHQVSRDEPLTVKAIGSKRPFRVQVTDFKQEGWVSLLSNDGLSPYYNFSPTIPPVNWDLLQKHCKDGKIHALLKLNVINVNQVNDENGYAVLHYLVEGKMVGGVQYFLERGSNIDTRCKEGWTPLLMAFRDETPSLPIIKLLLDSRPNCNISIPIGGGGGTTLHSCLEMKGKEADILPLISQIIDLQCDVNSADTEGVTPLMLAVKKEYHEIEQVLKSYHGRTVPPGKKNNTWCGNIKSISICLSN